MGTINVTFVPLYGREVVAAPSRMAFGTTTLVVTRDSGGFYIEAASITQDGIAHQREVFAAKTQAEIRAWFAGNRWNPGGAIGRPSDWLDARA